VRKYLFTLLIFLLALAPELRAERELIWAPDTTLIVGAPLPFDHVSFIDARTDKESIGWLKTGALNRYGALTTNDSLHLSLSSYTASLMRKTANNPGELLVVLRSFWLEDRKGTEEIGTVHFRADLFLGGAAGYQHLQSMDSLYESKNGWDVTASILHLGSQAIVDMIRIGGNAAPDASHTYSVAEALSRELLVLRQWPAYTAAPRRGIYRSFEDFLSLRPSDTGFFDQKIVAMEGPSQYVFHAQKENGKKGKRIGAEDCFAIYDGKLWHLARRNGFSQMSFQNGEFFAVQPLLGLTDNSVAMGVMFGLAGSTMAGFDQSKHYRMYYTRLDAEHQRFAPVRRSR